MIHLVLLSLGTVTVDLPLEARVRGTEIELGEVAAVTGADADEVGRIAALEIGYAPAPGYSRVLTADRLRDRIALRFPGTEVVFTGSRACRVWPEVVEVPGEDLLAAAHAELERVFGADGVRIESQSEVASVAVPAGGGPPRFVARVRSGEKAYGAVTVPVEVHVDGVRYRTVWTTWRVEAFATRPVLSRPVKAGEKLDATMFETRRVRVAAGRPREGLDPRTAIGAVARRDLRPGETVSPFDVNRPVVVNLGEPLLLRVHKGPITAQIGVQALESGAVGDRIRVLAGETGRELVATVRSRELCELHLR